MARISNEQILQAINTQSEALNGLTAAITAMVTAKPTAQPETEAKVAVARKSYTKTASATISSLPQVTTLPSQIKPDLLAGFTEKARTWRETKGLAQGDVAVVLLKSAYGKVSPRFFRMESKAPTNAIGIVTTV